MTETSSFIQLTAPAIMSFPHLIKPQQFTDNGKGKGDPKYGASFVLEPESPDLEPFKKHCARIAREKWPNIDLKEVTGWPFKNGTRLADKRAEKCKAAGKTPDGEWQRGKVVITARSEYRPRLAIIENGLIRDLDDEDAIKANQGKFYFGCLVLAQFNVVANAIKTGENAAGTETFNRYVSAYLNMVVSLNRGQRIGGARSAAEVFKGYAGQATMEDPTAGNLDDEIPF